MNNLKTVEDSVTSTDPLYLKQKEDVAKMRTSLLACDLDPSLTTTSMKTIAVLRVYHQMSRIIKYTEMMDKIENKLYEAIDNTLDSMDTSRASSWMTLLKIQEQLQHNMIESQKILQPFLDLTEFMKENAAPKVDNSPTQTISLDANKREKLRSCARQVLSELNVG